VASAVRDLGLLAPPHSCFVAVADFPAASRASIVMTVVSCVMQRGEYRQLSADKPVKSKSWRRRALAGSPEVVSARGAFGAIQATLSAGETGSVATDYVREGIVGI
jgi:hypothetical protein